MELTFTTNREEVGKDAVVASSGLTSRNRDFFSGKPFRVVPSGIRTDAFRKNPVLLWQHDADEPIGRAETFMHQTQLMARPEFHRMTKKSAVVADLWSAGFLNAVSIRLNLEPGDIEQIVETDDEIILNSSDLVELSVVTLPGDAGAVRQFLQSRQSDYSIETANFILNSFEAQSNSEVKKMDQNELIEETGVEPTAEAMETAPVEIVPFELDDESVNQLADGLGIKDLTEHVMRLTEYANQLEQRIAELEGQPVVKSRVGTPRFTFTSTQRQPPNSIAAPVASRPSTAVGRQIARMRRTK